MDKSPATAANFDDNTMWVSLADGRTLGVPLAWFPRLLAATHEARAAVTLSPLRPPLGGAGRGHLGACAHQRIAGDGGGVISGAKRQCCKLKDLTGQSIAIPLGWLDKLEQYPRPKAPIPEST